MKRIAIVITGGNIFVPKGLINACINRAYYLKEIANYKVDVYNIKYDYCKWSFKKWLWIKRHSKIRVGAIKVRILWKIEFFSRNWFLRKIFKAYYRFCKKKVITWDWKWLKEYLHYFRKYDLISVHSDVGANLGLLVKEKYGIPYAVTWHGSDIHTAPFESEAARELVIKTMENASQNFFVSNALLKISDAFSLNANKTVLYNGVGKEFYKYNESRRKELRLKYGVGEGKKVIAFAGTLREIKNADLLPDIFNSINSRYHDSIKFWIIGNGDMELTIREKIKRYSIECTLWGFQPIQEMPKLLNCVDVLILPSKNEGLPLITLEAISCGANVVGTMAGGIPETIGKEFCVEYSEGFTIRLADKVLDVLKNKPQQYCKDCFSWSETAKIENELNKKILKI